MALAEIDVLTVAMLILAYGLLIGLGKKVGAAFYMIAGVVAVIMSTELYTLTSDVSLTGVWLVIAIATVLFGIQDATG